MKKFEVFENQLAIEGVTQLLISHYTTFSNFLMLDFLSSYSHKSSSQILYEFEN